MKDSEWNDAQLLSWLRLMFAPGVGNTAAQRLLRTFGLPDAIFAQGRTALESIVTRSQATALLSQTTQAQAQFDLTRAWLANHPARALIPLGDPRYPAPLLTLPDPPLLLWAMGRMDLLQTQKEFPAALAIIGSRNPSPNGARTAYEFAASLAESGLCVISGMALGIDAAAHSGALDACAKDTDIIATVAVVGTGLDRVYPKQNLPLAHHIAQQGLILSEFPLSTPPLSTNFPKRNRLIAALGAGTLVIEATLQSGSLVTARVASELGREVFAVPGSIHQPQSKGCHRLIRQGAKLVESSQDVLEELQSFQVSPKPSSPTHPDRATTPATPDLDHPRSAPSPLLEAMGFDPIGFDALQVRTGIGVADLQAALLALELEGFITRLDGGAYQRAS